VVEGLRARGAEVVLVEGEAGSYCTTHPTQLNVARCTACAERICHGCQVAAGASLCPCCAAVQKRRKRNTYVRQLFALFVFIVFLLQLGSWRGREAALVDATGTIRVAFIQLVRPEAAGHPLVRAMDEGGIQAITRWFDEERARYGAPGGPVLAADVLGPWVTPVNPPSVPDRDTSWARQLGVSLAFPRYFHGLARRHGVDPDAYGARVYMVYGTETGDLVSDSRGSRTGRVAVSFLPVGASSLAYAQVTVAHELAHILGANDQYDPDTFLARFPEGYVQPWAERPYPQTYAELMAVDRPISPTDEQEVTSLDQVRIGYRTAAELGWISAEQADRYYTPLLTTPEARLAARWDSGEPVPD
jgi:hypothetical protein